MNTDQINAAFEKLIAERNVYKKLGISSGDARTMRYNIKNKIPISTGRKIELLKKAGLLDQGKAYIREDLVSLLNFNKKTSQAARDEGIFYIIEKWERSKK